MEQTIIIDRIQFSAIKVNSVTEWVFLELFDSGGLHSLAELGVGKNTNQIISKITEIFDLVAGNPLKGETELLKMVDIDPSFLKPLSSTSVAISALRSAIAILEAEYLERSLSENLGGLGVKNVELYANINRTLLTRDRSPTNFGRTAEKIVKLGFRTIKCAPFDEVDNTQTLDAAIEASKNGVARVSAVRKAIGPDIQLLVDCHRRFDIQSAIVVSEDMAKLGVNWFEEPVDTETKQDEMAEIARRICIPVAGGESLYGLESFESLISKGAVQVIMPDVMFCGGATEAYKTGLLAASNSVGFSPHSPSGTVSTLTSAHVCASIPDVMPLEHAVDEASWRSEILDPPELVENGMLWLPNGAGLGAKLNTVTVNRRGRTWNP